MTQVGEEEELVEDPAQAKRKSWTKIWTYVVLVAVLTLTMTWVTHQLPIPGRLKAAMVMWMPGLSAIGVKLAYDRSLEGLGLGKSGGLWLLVGLLVPLAYALPVYLTAWLSGVGGFDAERWRTQLPYLGDPGTAGAALGLLLTVGLLDKLYRALGEEIGWRGFLAPELMKHMSLWKAGVFSGAIWAAWHLPAIFFSGYNAEGGPPMAYQIGCFALMVILGGVIYAWVRARSMSVWPCALLHASHNLFVQPIFDGATVNRHWTQWLTGEFGAGLVITSLVTVALVLTLRGRSRAAQPAMA